MWVEPVPSRSIRLGNKAPIRHHKDLHRIVSWVSYVWLLAWWADVGRTQEHAKKDSGQSIHGVGGTVLALLQPFSEKVNKVG